MRGTLVYDHSSIYHEPERGKPTTTVEQPNHDQEPVMNLHGTGISIRLGLNFDHAGINNDMTHAIVLSVKVQRNSSQNEQSLVIYTGQLLASNFFRLTSIEGIKVTGEKLQSS